MTKNTLLETVREYGIHEIKTVSELTKTSHQTLNNWMKHKPELLKIVLIGVKNSK